MPVKSCLEDGKKGWKWGDAGKCYTYSDEEGSKKAKQKAFVQGYAATGGKGEEVERIVFTGDGKTSFVSHIINLKKEEGQKKDDQR